MSTVNIDNLQLGRSSTAADNFTWYQHPSLDGTVRLGTGNSGATTSDIIVVDAAGYVGINNTAPSVSLDVTGEIHTSGQVRVGDVLLFKATSSSISTSTTLSTSALLNGLLIATITASSTWTLPTGTNLDAAFSNLDVNQAFRWSIFNNTVYTLSLAPNTNHTQTGNTAIAANAAASYVTRKTATNTFVTSRV